MRSDTLAQALTYRDCGLSIIPLNMASKIPAVQWKRYQAKQATESTVRSWFGNSKTYGVAVIFGAVSGGLASRDFDDLGSYERWANANPELARTLPTVETRRGRHVYFQAAPECIQALRSRLGKPDGTGAIPCGDGELRCGTGCYSVLPPSRHPSGHVYRWCIPLPVGSLPEIDPIVSGLAPESLPEAERAEKSERTKRTEESRSNVNCEGVFDASNAREWPEAVQRAILDTLPQGPGRRHRAVFAFARAMKGISDLRDAAPMALEPYLRQWHRQSLPVIGTKPYEETLVDFLSAWPRVRFPGGAEPMQEVLARAKAATVPAEALEFEQHKLRLLVALCRELQATVGDAPFFLASRTAAKLLDVPPAQAWRWLFLLEQKGILLVVERGSRNTNRASRFRYVFPV